MTTHELDIEKINGERPIFMRGNELLLEVFHKELMELVERRKQEQVSEPIRILELGSGELSFYGKCLKQTMKT